jgi:hypothetical protein
MMPPIFKLVSASQPCKDILGTKPVRFYDFDSAPQNVTKPYATWQLTLGSPENYIDCPPDIDSITIQVDCWSESAQTTRAMAEAIRGAVEMDAHVISVNIEGRDPDTRLYRITLIIDFWLARA